MNKYSNYLNLLVLIILILPLKTNAQEEWTLEKCIKYAIENNISLKQQIIYADYKKNQYLQSKFAVLPNINAGADQNYTWGRSVDPYTNEFITNKVRSNNFYISSSVTLFNGFQIYNTIKQNQYSYFSSQQDVEKIKNDVILNLATSYLQILFNEELLAISKNQLAVSQQQIDRTTILVQAGTLAKGNLLDIQAQAATEELQLINAQNQLSASILTLKQLLELKSDSAIAIKHPDLTDPENDLLTTTIEEVYQTALNRPEVKSAEFQLISSQKSLAISRGGISPRISLQAAYYTGYSEARPSFIPGAPVKTKIGYVGSSNEAVYQDMNSVLVVNYPFKDQLKDNASKMLAIRITVPIFNNLTVQNYISNSKINVLNSSNTLELTKNNLYKQIQQAYSDAIAALTKYKGSKKALAAAEESFRYMEQKFNLGVVNSIEYSTAKNKLSKSKSDVLQAKYEYIFKKTILTFYSGKSIQL